MFRLTPFRSIRPTNSMSRKNPFLFAYMDFGSWLFRLMGLWAERILNKISYFNSAQFVPLSGGSPGGPNSPTWGTWRRYVEHTTRTPRSPRRLGEMRGMSDVQGSRLAMRGDPLLLGKPEARA